MTLKTLIRAPGGRWRSIRVATVAAIMVAATLLGAPRSASASTPGQFVSWYWLEDATTYRCLDTGADGSAWTTPCNVPYTVFEQATTPWDGYDQYLDYQTGRCLDSNDSGAVYSSPCNWNNTYQAWIFLGTGGVWTLENRQTGRCLDSNFAGNIYTSPCNLNNSFENWYSVHPPF